MTDDRALELAEALLHEYRTSAPADSRTRREYTEACAILSRIREEHDPKNRPTSNAGFVTQ